MCLCASGLCACVEPSYLLPQNVHESICTCPHRVYSHTQAGARAPRTVRGEKRGLSTGGMQKDAAVRHHASAGGVAVSHYGPPPPLTAKKRKSRICFVGEAFCPCICLPARPRASLPVCLSVHPFLPQFDLPTDVPIASIHPSNLITTILPYR